MLTGKDDDHKHSTCDPKGANIDAQNLKAPLQISEKVVSGWRHIAATPAYTCSQSQQRPRQTGSLRCPNPFKIIDLIWRT